MRVSNPTYIRVIRPEPGRFHILSHVDDFARYMTCGAVVNASRAVEVRFDFDADAIRESVCGVCVAIDAGVIQAGER